MGGGLDESDEEIAAADESTGRVCSLVGAGAVDSKKSTVGISDL
jgi:hypothetical protein